MTLSELTREIGDFALKTVRTESDIKGWINRSQRAIAQRHNFSFMFSRQSATMTAGATSANLSARFKELAAEKSPIAFNDPSNADIVKPVHVKSRAELERLAPGFAGLVTNAPNGFGSPYYVFLEQTDGGTWTINVLAAYPLETSITYRISCFLFPSDLSLGTDHNGITDDADLGEAMIHWVKGTALAKMNSTDPQAAASLGIFETNLRKAINADARRKIAGRSLRM